MINVVSYKCIKCSKDVAFEIRDNMQDVTVKLWESLFDTKLCYDCHDDKKLKTLYYN